jgi:hypothetical protein
MRDIRRRYGRRHEDGWWRAAAVVLGLLVLAAFAGCGSSSGPSQAGNVGLILAGSTNDHPSQPPTIASGGPGGAYAFVYDNQIWLHQSGATEAKQLTHLALSNGATLSWGPLVWSHSGKYIAFVLVQDLNLAPGTPPRSSGTIYYVDASSGAVMVSPGTGSIYGHTYTWIGDAMLLYASGSGLMLYTLDTPRVWPVRDIPSGPSGSGSTDYLFFGDVAAVNGYVYYTRLDVKTPGHTGAVGTASLVQTYLGLTDASATPPVWDLAGRLPLTYANVLASLGTVYTDPAGNFAAGTWQVRSGGGVPSFVAQRIESVDVSGGKVTSRLCVVQYSACDSTVLAPADVQPIGVRPQLAVTRDGKVAFTADGVYLLGASGKLGPAGWMTPPAWSSDGQSVAVTQLVGQAADASGVVRYQTNVVLYHSGQQAGSTLIAGGSNLAWAPA